MVGWVSSSYNQQLNKVILKIEEAKVILDVDLFGKNIVITELDIANYFDKPFKLDGPQPMSEHIEFTLPDGYEIFNKNNLYDVINENINFFVSYFNIS